MKEKEKEKEIPPSSHTRYRKPETPRFDKIPKYPNSNTCLLPSPSAKQPCCSRYLNHCVLDRLHHPPLFERSQYVSLFWTYYCSVSVKQRGWAKLPKDGAGARESTRITRVTILWTLIASESSMVGIRTRDTRIR